MKKQDRGPAALKHISAVECSGRLLRWITENVYHTPIDDFRVALGAVWLSFCFDHGLNPFVELHSILDVFPFREALGTVVPKWATVGSAAQPPPDSPAPLAAPKEEGRESAPLMPEEPSK